MNKHLHTYYADAPNEGQYCEVHFDFKEEHAYITSVSYTHLTLPTNREV